jgi:hypothetical protein
MVDTAHGRIRGPQYCLQPGGPFALGTVPRYESAGPTPGTNPSGYRRLTCWYMTSWDEPLDTLAERFNKVLGVCYRAESKSGG